MKTATTSRSMRCCWLRPAAAVLLVVGFASSLATALNPPAHVTVPTTATAVETDPYLAFLESLDTRDVLCREHSVTLRSLLAERDRLVRAFLQATPAGRADLHRALEELARGIDDAETSLEAAVAASEPNDAPNLAPLPVIDVDAIREQSKRWRRPIYLPVPPPLAIPALPPPAGEKLYLEYLAIRADSSKFAQTLVADVTRLLHERRELAYRHAHARAPERARLETTIRAVSLHLRISSHAAAEGVVVSNW